MYIYMWDQTEHVPVHVTFSKVPKTAILPYTCICNSRIFLYIHNYIVLRRVQVHDIPTSTCTCINKATSDLSFTGQVPHLTIVHEEGKVVKAGFLRERAVSSACVYTCRHTYIHARYIHVSTHEHTYMYILNQWLQKKLHKH